MFDEDDDDDVIAPELRRWIERINAANPSGASHMKQLVKLYRSRRIKIKPPKIYARQYAISHETRIDN